jgi:sarcosine oxidase subunit beta
MTEHFHTIVIGGGCLGCSAAIALARRLGPAERVCIVEKSITGAGLSSRHSGIIQAADPSSQAAIGLVGKAVRSWTHLKDYWGIDLPVEQPGALWITSNSPGTTERWRTIQNALAATGVGFHGIESREARELAGTDLRLDENESCFFEPDALALNMAQALCGLQQAIRASGAVIKERTEIRGFETDGQGRIKTVKTDRGDLAAEFVVNAAGGWSPKLFTALDISIPVALVPTYIAHWLVGCGEMPGSLPIVADDVNRVYFRSWPGSVIRMHQPRDRRSAAIARSFSRESTEAASPDIILEPSNYLTHHGLLDPYRAKLQHRFPEMGPPIFAGGFVSYFDITPDLNFILGPDNRIENLVHCLGAGVGFKFAPLFGQIISDMILDRQVPENLAEFSIARFKDRPLEDFLGAGYGAIEPL